MACGQGRKDRYWSRLLELAFSRRICCSRVASVKTNPSFFRQHPWSFQSKRPGSNRRYLFVLPSMPRAGPPKERGQYPDSGLHRRQNRAPKAARTFEQTVGQGFGKPGPRKMAFRPWASSTSGLQVFDAAEKIGRLNGHGAVILDFRPARPDQWYRRQGRATPQFPIRWVSK